MVMSADGHINGDVPSTLPWILKTDTHGTWILWTDTYTEMFYVYHHCHGYSNRHTSMNRDVDMLTNTFPQTHINFVTMYTGKAKERKAKRQNLFR